jgi:Flp pilus assembly pilin Flp
VKDLLTSLYVRVSEWQRGQTMAEYALIMAAIAVVCIVAYNELGTQVSTKIGEVTTDLGG